MDESPEEVKQEISGYKYVVKHTLINRKERRRREKERRVKYAKRNRPYVKGNESVE